MSNAYIFYGKAGSGKGTQALELKKYLENQGKKVIYIETGALLRNFVAANTTFTATRTSEIIDQGKLMPPFMPIYLWAHELVQNCDGSEEIIMDGVMRRMEEAPILASALEFFQIPKVLVMGIHISDEEALKRLSIRTGRADDASPEKIQQRLSWYQTNVLPIIEYYKSNHSSFTFVDINGEETVEGVFDQIKQAIS